MTARETADSGNMSNNDARDEMIMRCYNAWNPHQHHWPPHDAFAAGWRWRSEVENAELAEQAAEVEQLKALLVRAVGTWNPDDKRTPAWLNDMRAWLTEHGAEPTPATVEPMVELLSPLTENFPLAPSVPTDTALIGEIAEHGAEEK